MVVNMAGLYGAEVNPPPGRARLSQERIVTIAVAIADQEGLSAVSMRRLARDLSVTAMALYRHFDDKDDLIDAMAERAVAEARFVDDPDSGWDLRFRSVLSGLVSVLHEHPWMGRPLIERLVPSPKYLEALEILLASARQVGLNTEEAVILTQQAVQAVVTLVDYEPSPKPVRKWRAERDALLELDLTRYPNVRAAATPLSGHFTPDTYYRLGLDTIIAGIAGQRAT